MFYLYKDMSDEFNQSYEKIVRAPYSTLEEAMMQAEHDLFYGYRVLCIEEADDYLGGEHATALERGRKVWEPKGSEGKHYGRLLDPDDKTDLEAYQAELSKRVASAKK
jgi:hypothetical protein